MSKYITSTILLAVAFLILLPARVMAGVGVSPGAIDNKHLKPGASYRQEIVISQSSAPIDLKVTIEPDMGKANSWFTFEPGLTFTINKGQQRFPFLVNVNVPPDALLQEYNGYLRIKVTPAAINAGGISVVQGARIDVNLLATNLDFTALSVRSLFIEDTTVIDPLKLKIKIQNKGNVAAAPTSIRVQVQDLNQNPLKNLELTTTDKVGPGELKDIDATAKHGLGEGEYFAAVRVMLGDEELRSERLVFKVREATDRPLPTDNGINPITVVSVGIGLVTVVLLIIIIVILLRRKQRKQKIVSTVEVTPQLTEKSHVVHKRKRKTTKKRKKSVAAASIIALAALTPLIVSSLESTTNPAGRPLIVEQQGEVAGSNTQKGTQSGYNVYRHPDLASTVIYQAPEGESFAVIKEVPGWYQVMLKTGQVGWLHTSSVKDKLVEER